MERNLKQHPKVLDPTENAGDIKDQMKLVGDLLFESSNVDIKAQGTILKGKVILIDGSIAAQISAQTAAETATSTLLSDCKDGCNAYDVAAKVVEGIFPDDSDKWEAFGLKVTSAIAHTKTLAPKVTNGSMMQGEFLKECIIKFDLSAGADNYTVEITTKDPSEPSSYILVTNPKMIFTTIKISFIVPDDYLGLNLWAKVTAHNSAGASPASNPFGGIKIQ